MRRKNGFKPGLEEIPANSSAMARPAGAIPGTAPWKRMLEELFGVDVRSLALFRISIAVVILADLATRATDLEANYTDFGLLPRVALLTHLDSLNIPFCLHLASGELWFQALLFLTAAFFALWLLVGYRTKLATFLSFLMLVSLQNRNSLISDGGDVLLRVLLFWSLFVPLGETWSVDALRLPRDNAATGRPPLVVSAGTVAILLQLCFMYVFSALIKSYDVWWKEGTAVYYAFSIKQFATPLALFCLQYPPLLFYMSRGVFAFELVGPFLAFIPVYRGPIRATVALVFLQLHLVGMALFLELGVFPFICAAAWTLFLPPWFWDNFLPPRAARLRESALGKRLRQIRFRTADDSGWTRSTESIGISFSDNVRRKLNIAYQCAIGLLLAYVFLWNLRSTNYKRYEPVFPASLNIVGQVTQLQQYWDMFAPWPMKDSGWYVIPAVLKDGSTVDLYTGDAVSWERPPLISATYKNARWRKYFINYTFGNEKVRLYYGQYMARKWNRNNPADKQVLRFDVYFNRERTLPDYQKSDVARMLLWHHECK